MGLLIGVGQTRPTFPYDNYYGVEWDKTLPNPSCKRIGKIELHKSLPVQSKMKRCILKDDGSVAYYLDPNDSSLKADGTRADLTGADGQYMVELPEVYVRFEEDGNICRAMMSEHPLPGFTRWGKDYVSVAEATMDLDSNSLASVDNISGRYGGADGCGDLLTSLTAARTAARRRGNGWNCYTYQIHRKLYWFFVIEYATRNSQEAFTPQLTPEGFKQGGLGKGVTIVPWEEWNAYNCCFPFIPIGFTTYCGNHTRIEDWGGDLGNIEVPSYRGVQNPFGHLWLWVDGVLVTVSSKGISNVYVCDDPEKFADTLNDGYKMIGRCPAANGFINDIILGANGDIIPSGNGGSSTTYFCDGFYTRLPVSGESIRGILVSGSAFYGNYAGMSVISASNEPSASFSTTGSRLTYTP